MNYTVMTLELSSKIDFKGYITVQLKVIDSNEHPYKYLLFIIQILKFQGLLYFNLIKFKFYKNIIIFIKCLPVS